MKRLIMISLTFILVLGCGFGCGTQYRVDFVSGDEVIKTLKTDKGGTVWSVESKVDGYVFEGWYEESSEEKFDFSSPITRDLILHARYYDVVNDEYTRSPLPLQKENVDGDNALYGDIGRVLECYKTPTGYYSVAVAYKGYHTEDKPSMTMGVVTSKDGIIRRVVKLASYAQTEGYAEQITQDYLDGAYTGKECLTTLEVTPVSGATVTSTAALWATHVVANFLEKQYGIKADVSAAEKQEFNAVVEAEYTTVNTDYSVDASIGTVVYAAQGLTSSGQKVLALKVKGARTVDRTGAFVESWDKAIPASPTLIIVIDQGTDQVIATSVTKLGAAYPLFFLPSGSLEAYKSVKIDSSAFDDFDGGLVKGLEFETDSESGLITGTSIPIGSFTGATKNGTFTSQMVRNAFRAAALYYVNTVKA